MLAWRILFANKGVLVLQILSKQQADVYLYDATGAIDNDSRTQRLTVQRRIGKFKAGTSESPGGPQISNTSASHVIRECQAAFQYRILTVEMLGPKLWLQ